jgi:hypothetical protein
MARSLRPQFVRLFDLLTAPQALLPLAKALEEEYILRKMLRYPKRL